MQRPTAVRGGGAFGAPHGAPFGGAHAPTRLGRAFRSVDFYRKLPRDMTEGTVSGSVISIFAAVLMTFLLLSELRSYSSSSFDTKVVVDRSVDGELLLIIFNLSFTALSCEFASVYVGDAL